MHRQNDKNCSAKSLSVNGIHVTEKREIGDILILHFSTVWKKWQNVLN